MTISTLLHYSKDFLKTTNNSNKIITNMHKVLNEYTSAILDENTLTISLSNVKQCRDLGDGNFEITIDISPKNLNVENLKSQEIKLRIKQALETLHVLKADNLFETIMYSMTTQTDVHAILEDLMKIFPDSEIGMKHCMYLFGKIDEYFPLLSAYYNSRYELEVLLEKKLFKEGVIDFVSILNILSDDDIQIFSKLEDIYTIYKNTKTSNRGTCCMNLSFIKELASLLENFWL